MIGHLIHIGFAKAASNFLQDWFAQHPQLAYVPGGVAGFQTVYAIAGEAASDRTPPLYCVTSYEGLATPHTSAGLIAVDYDAMQRNSMKDAQIRACELLAGLFPNAHILIVTRGFRSMMLSSYSQYVRSGGLKSLAELCASTDLGADAGRSPLNYDFIIGLYRRAFDGAKVIVLPCELLRDDPAAFLHEITQRLGLSAVGVPLGRPNPSLTAIELAWYPRLGRRVRALPLGKRGRRAAWQLYVHAAFANRLRRPVAMLQRLWPVPPVDDSPLTSELVQNVRGLASSLRDEPLYRAYARDYLFD